MNASIHLYQTRDRFESVASPPHRRNLDVRAGRVDASFAALADPTRRGVLEQLGRADASITDLADRFRMTLTGMKKHVGVLEQAGLVTLAPRVDQRGRRRGWACHHGDDMPDFMRSLA